MSRLLLHGPELAVTAVAASWSYVGFEAVRLQHAEHWQRRAEREELCVVLLAGSCEISLNGGAPQSLAGRESVFAGPPDAIYLPPGGSVAVEATSDFLELAIGSAPAERGAEARILPASGARFELRGSGVMERRIHHIMMEDQPAQRLLVTEVVTPGGNWSSFPPHKHDTEDFPNETYLEETYYYRFRNPRGFALQRVYSSDRSLDETITARDGDLVLVPRGYHGVSAAPGYDTYYLNVMAGPIRAWKVTYDPDHAWLQQ